MTGVKLAVAHDRTRGDSPRAHWEVHNVEGKRTFLWNMVVCWAHPQQGHSASLGCHISGKPMLEVVPVGIGVEISTKFSQSHSGRDLLPTISVFSLSSIPAEAQDSWRRAAALFAAGGIKPMGFQTSMDILI